MKKESISQEGKSIIETVRVNENIKSIDDLKTAIDLAKSFEGELNVLHTDSFDIYISQYDVYANPMFAGSVESSTDLQKQDSTHCDYQDSTPCNCITSKINRI